MKSNLEIFFRLTLFTCATTQAVHEVVWAHLAHAEYNDNQLKVLTLVATVNS